MEIILIIFACAIIICIWGLYYRIYALQQSTGRQIEAIKNSESGTWSAISDIRTNLAWGRSDASIWAENVRKEMRELADKLGYEWKEESKEAGFVKKPTAQWGCTDTGWANSAGLRISADGISNIVSKTKEALRKQKQRRNK